MDWLTVNAEILQTIDQCEKWVWKRIRWNIHLEYPTHNIRELDWIGRNCAGEMFKTRFFRHFRLEKNLEYVNSAISWTKAISHFAASIGTSDRFWVLLKFYIKRIQECFSSINSQFFLLSFRGFITALTKLNPFFFSLKPNFGYIWLSLLPF